MRTPWILRGRTGRLIGRWLNRHGWELHRIVYAEAGMPLAKVRIQPGRPVRPSDVVDTRTFGLPSHRREEWRP